MDAIFRHPTTVMMMIMSLHTHFFASLCWTSVQFDYSQHSKQTTGKKKKNQKEKNEEQKAEFTFPFFGNWIKVNYFIYSCFEVECIVGLFLDRSRSFSFHQWKKKNWLKETTEIMSVCACVVFFSFENKTVVLFIID